MVNLKFMYERHFINEFEKKKFMKNVEKNISMFQNFNLKHHIFDCIWFCKKSNRIQQILEAPIENKNELFELWEKIKNDKRHIIKHKTFFSEKI